MDYSQLSTRDLHLRRQTLEIGLAILEKFPEDIKRDKRYAKRVKHYKGALNTVRAELAARGGPVTIQAKTARMRFGQRKE